MEPSLLSVRVWGDQACFTRPEFKVERVSYPVITPSAARGVLESIFWKPEVRWEVRRIGVVKMGREAVIVRNEIGKRQGAAPIVASDSDVRQQRSTLMLRDVEYVIEAEIVLRQHATDPLPKYRDQFRRRVERGQCFQTPYLGTRECSAFFGPVDEGGSPDESLNRRLGTMLFDIAFVPSATRKELAFRHATRGETSEGFAEAVYFDAVITNGWMTVESSLYLKMRTQVESVDAR